MLDTAGGKAYKGVAGWTNLLWFIQSWCPGRSLSPTGAAFYLPFETGYYYCRYHACKHSRQDAEEKLLHSRHHLIVDAEDCPKMTVHALRQLGKLRPERPQGNRMNIAIS
jgi:hypothetical protein